MLNDTLPPSLLQVRLSACVATPMSGVQFHSRTEVPDSGRARLSDEALGNCNLSSNGYLSLRASWRSFGEGVADQEDACRGQKRRCKSARKNHVRSDDKKNYTS